MCHLALSNCHICNNHTPKRPVIENKSCNICMTNLNMGYVGACTCKYTLFLTRSDTSSLSQICLERRNRYLVAIGIQIANFLKDKTVQK